MWYMSCHIVSCHFPSILLEKTCFTRHLFIHSNIFYFSTRYMEQYKLPQEYYFPKYSQNDPHVIYEGGILMA